VSYQNYI